MDLPNPPNALWRLLINKHFVVAIKMLKGSEDFREQATVTAGPKSLYPLHFALSVKGCPDELIVALVQANTTAAKHRNHYLELPLHEAIQQRRPLVHRESSFDGFSRVIERDMQRYGLTMLG
jgi:hypothetical protein